MYIINNMRVLSNKCTNFLTEIKTGVTHNLKKDSRYFLNNWFIDSQNIRKMLNSYSSQNIHLTIYYSKKASTLKKEQRL